MGSQRKGAGSSVDWFPLVFRCRSLGNHQDIGTPLVDSAFVWVGLKRGSGKRRAGEGTRPYGVSRTGNVCSAKPGAEVEPHQRQFLQTQGPVARWELRKATQILRAGRALPTQRDNPHKRGPGKVVLWARSAHRPRPRWRFGSFAAMGKGTRRPGPRPARKGAYPWRRNRKRQVLSLWTKLNLHDYWCKIKMATSPKYWKIF